MTSLQTLFALWLYNKNAITGRYYHGIENQELLDANQFKSKMRMTFLQAKNHGYKVKKWSKANIVKYESYPTITKETATWETTLKTIPRIIYHHVFNLEQLESINPRPRLQSIKHIWLQSIDSILATIWSKYEPSL
jgi:antirestriction protein ArdC